MKDSKSRIPDSSADKELKTVEEKRIEDAKTDDEMNGVDKEETGSETSTTDSDGSKSDVRKAKAIKSWHSAVVLCTTLAACGSKTGLRLLVFKKFTPIITGRDKFFKTIFHWNGIEFLN